MREKEPMKLPKLRDPASYMREVTRVQEETVLACNEKTGEYGLLLTEEEAHRLILCKNETLTETGRVEFRESAVPALLFTFMDSPYLDRNSYADTVSELIRLFYLFCGETEDRVSDRDLLDYMKLYFDGPAGGSADAMGEGCITSLRAALADGTFHTVLRKYRETKAANREGEDWQ